jgi:20S proteasome subunit alpha 7
LAKNEIEKLKLDEMTCREAINEAARMCVPFFSLRFQTQAFESSIYQVHDDAKDKDFELEMTWVSDTGKLCSKERGEG